MARIRTIKPEFWHDEDLGKTCLQARLLFIGIINLSDDYGICRANVKWIKAQLFPYDDNLRIGEVSQWIDQLVKNRMLVPFDIEDESYLYVRSFSVHQKIDKPSKNGTISADKMRRVLSLSETPKTFDEYSANIPRILAVGKGRERDREMEKDILSPDGVTEGEPSVPEKPVDYKSIPKTKKGIYDFIKKNKITEIQPYVDFWNIFALERKFPQVSKVNDKRQKKFSIRIRDKDFDFIQIIAKAAKSQFISEGNWFTFDWIIENETNYLKVLEGKYDGKQAKQPGQSADDLREEQGRAIINAVN